MTTQFHVGNYRVRLVCEYEPRDFAFCYFYTLKFVYGITGQFGSVYYYFAFMKA